MPNIITAGWSFLLLQGNINEVPNSKKNLIVLLPFSILFFSLIQSLSFKHHFLHALHDQILGTSLTIFIHGIVSVFFNRKNILRILNAIIILGLLSTFVIFIISIFGLGIITAFPSFRNFIITVIFSFMFIYLVIVFLAYLQILMQGFEIKTGKAFLVASSIIIFYFLFGLFMDKQGI